MSSTGDDLHDRLDSALRRIEQLEQENAELKRISQFYAEMQEHAPAVLFRYDILQKQFTFVSDFASDFSNLDVDSILASDLEATVDMFHPDDRDRVRSDLDALFQGTYPGEPHLTLEFRIPNKQGMYKWWSAETAVLRDAAGNACILLGVVVDIHRQKTAEAARLEAEERYQFLVDNAPIGIVRTTPDGRYILANKRVAEIYGYDSPHDLMESVKDIKKDIYLHPRDREEAVERINTTDDWVTVETDRKRKDGSIVRVVTTIRAVRSALGKVAYYDGFVHDVTRPRQMEQALLESEHKYKSLFNSMSAAFVLLQAVYADDGDIKDFLRLEVNPAFEKQLGLRVEDVVGKTTLEVFPTMEQEHLDRLKSVLRFGEPRHIEEFIPWLGGWNKVIIFKAGEHRVAVIFENITKKKEAEQALIESEIKFRTLYETTEQGIIHVDDKGRLVSANPAAEKILGLSLDEMKGKSTYSPQRTLLQEDGSPFPPEEFPSTKVLRTKEPVSGVLIGAHNPRLNQIRWLTVHAVPVFSPNREKLTGVYTGFSDITERKQAEQALAKSEARLNEAQIIAKIGSFERILPNGESYWSDALYRIFGYEPGEVEPTFDFFKAHVHPEDQSVLTDLLDQAESGHDVIDYEFRFHPRNGPLRIGRSLGRFFRDDSGKALRMAGIMQDITEQRLLEESLRKAKDKAEAADKSKSEFLANMSHEIRTPLNGVMGMLQLLKTTDMTREQREYVDISVKSGKSLLTVINDILDFSKIEAGMVEIAKEPFSLRTTVETVMEVFSEQACSKRLKCFCTIPDHIPDRLLGDPGRLRQILFNLVGNALKFTPRGEVSVTVSLIREHPDLRLLFAVKDTGIGIPDENILAVFDPFYQTDGSLTRKYQGTGLGLGIVKRLVELMGGEVSVVSTEGEGSKFYFSLAPARDTTEPQTPKPHVPAKRKASSSTGGVILLAEDDRINRMAVERRLNKAGYRTLCADNGMQALDILRREAVDLVLMDVRMPVMDGREALRRIRAGQTPQPEVPVAALTAHALKGDREGLLDRGFDAYLPKPVDLDELLETIPKLLKP